MAIARIWTARATKANADAYPRHFRDKVLPHLDATPGFLGAMLMRREEGGEVEYTVLTRWVSLDSIRKFAGVDIDTAVVDSEAAAALTSYDKTVRHCEILEKVWSTR
ncbi:MAG TPA: antibiotic biosynthesis monooxygenase [Candidatus Cybelea sp.]|nr:antibiotic biosynthesis monooxygenase [Candidatus Cybelea sp.]